jgi:hypothetical protein
MNRVRRSRLHAALFLGVALAATGIGLVAYGTNVFRELDLQSVDARFSIRGTEPAPRDIVVVKIDDVTFGVAQRKTPVSPFGPTVGGREHDVAGLRHRFRSGGCRACRWAQAR